jgi:hypothetical protein
LGLETQNIRLKHIESHEHLDGETSFTSAARSFIVVARGSDTPVKSMRTPPSHFDSSLGFIYFEVRN